MRREKKEKLKAQEKKLKGASGAGMQVDADSAWYVGSAETTDFYQTWIEVKKQEDADDLLRRHRLQQSIVLQPYQQQFMQQLAQQGASHGNRGTNAQVHSNTANVTGAAGQQSHGAASLQSQLAAVAAQYAAAFNSGSVYSSDGIGSSLAGLAASLGIPESSAHALPLKVDKTQFGEIVAWRMWRLHKGFLKSYSRESLWVPGVPMTEKKLTDRGNEGIWCFKSKERALKKMLDVGYRGEPTVYGSIKIWGKIIEHTEGYRAENALVTSIEGVWLGEKNTQPGAYRDLVEELRDKYLPTQAQERTRES